MAGYVLDTSAVMALLLDEEGAEQVKELIYSPSRVRLPFIALMEVEYQLIRLKPEVVDESLSFIDAWPIVVPESYLSWRRTAARVKSLGRLSVADAWMAALALIEDADLVHKDPEFDAVAGLKVFRLPYDRDTRRGNRG